MSYLIDGSGKRYTWGGKSVAFPSWGSGGGSTLLNGLVSYWKLDDAADASALDSIGFQNGAVTASYMAGSTGKIGTSFLFNDGSSNKVILGLNNLSSATALSISGWIKAESQYRWGAIYSSGNTFYLGYQWYAFQDTRYCLAINSSELAIGPTDANWHHMVGTYDSTLPSNNMKLYVDGSLVAQQTKSGTLTSSTIQTLGQFTGSDYLGGNLDEIGKWNRALTQSEVTELYNSGVGKTYPFTPSSYVSQYETIYNSFSTKPSSTIATAQNTMVSSLVSNGIWDKLDLFYVFANNASDNALKNWKTPGTYDATNIHSTAFTSYEGFTGDGVNDYLNTNWNPSTNAINYTTSGANVGIYLRLDSSLSQAAFGAGDYDRTQTVFFPTNTGAVYISSNRQSLSNTTLTNTQGLFTLVRSNNNVTSLYKNDTSIFTDIYTTTDGVKPNINMHVLARNGASNSSNQASIFYTGGNLSTVDVSIMYLITNTYLNNVTPELITNGTFNSNTIGWEIQGTWEWETDGAGGGWCKKIVGQNNVLYTTNEILTVGRTYNVIYTLSGRTNGTITAECGYGGVGTVRSVDGTYSENIVCSGNGYLRFSTTTTLDGHIDNVSVKQVL